MLKDQFGRQVDYIRVSLTDRCNLRCRYCMPEGCVNFMAHDEILRVEETARLCAIFAKLGVSKFKITGGEPFVYQGVMPFLRSLRENDRIDQVTITTNGVTLERYLPELVELNINGLNISLDTLQPETFKQLTGADVHDRVMQSIAAAARTSIPVKLNCLPIQGINTHELAEIAALAQYDVAAVRFIELMPIGMGETFTGIPTQQLISQMADYYGDLQPYDQPLGNGPAVYYSVPGFNGKLGFINAISQCFCEGCNRVRLTSDGYLKLCLAFEEGIDLKTPLRNGASDEELSAIIADAVYHKPKEHDFNRLIREKKRSMHRVGG